MHSLSFSPGDSGLCCFVVVVAVVVGPLCVEHCSLPLSVNSVPASRPRSVCESSQDNSLSYSNTITVAV